MKELEAGPELDAQIAQRVMEWKRCQPIDAEYLCRNWYDQNGKFVHSDFWSPSTQIEAAWEVVEVKTWTLLLDKTLDKCLASFTFLRKGAFWKYSAEAKTAPHAICLAALAALGEKG